MRFKSSRPAYAAACAAGKDRLRLCRSTWSAAVANAPFEEAPFRRISRQLQGSLEFFPRFAQTTETAFKLTPRGVIKRVPEEAPAVRDPIDLLEAARRTLVLRDGHRAIQGHDGRRLNAHQR